MTRNQGKGCRKADEGSGNSSSRAFLPMTRAEMDLRGWSELDILLISGDAYIDHPAFGVPLLGRLLEKQGWRVGIVAQPRWDNSSDISRMGAPAPVLRDFGRQSGFHAVSLHGFSEEAS